MTAIIDCVAGARPNFMKLAPVVRALAGRSGVRCRIVHTGQHYDAEMSDVFFSELEIRPPDIHLEVGSGSHGAQTARILERYEEHLLAHPPAVTVVFGDVNSTLACSLAAVKLEIPVAHVEAGLRSFDRTMPEEINRMVTDAVADLLLVSEPSGMANLRREGVEESKLRLVGNVMIDTLYQQLPRARARESYRRLGLSKGGYGLVTLHRPSNVDEPGILTRLLELLVELGRELPLVFPVHPRTARAAERAGLQALVATGGGPLVCLGPQPYIDTLSLLSGARVVLTDSGGLQEESSVLGIPCLTLRNTTERPITVERGTSRLFGNDAAKIRTSFHEAVAGRWPSGDAIPLWDGQAGDRIAAELTSWLAAR